MFLFQICFELENVLRIPDRFELYQGLTSICRDKQSLMVSKSDLHHIEIHEKLDSIRTEILETSAKFSSTQVEGLDLNQIAEKLVHNLLTLSQEGQVVAKQSAILSVFGSAPCLYATNGLQRLTRGHLNGYSITIQAPSPIG